MKYKIMLIFYLLILTSCRSLVYPEIQFYDIKTNSLLINQKIKLYENPKIFEIEVSTIDPLDKIYPIENYILIDSLKIYPSKMKKGSNIIFFDFTINDTLVDLKNKINYFYSFEMNSKKPYMKDSIQFKVKSTDFNLGLNKILNKIWPNIGH